MNKTKLINFTYTKDNGDVSNRTGITLGYSSPTLGLIVDISSSDLDSEDKAFLLHILGVKRKNYLEEIQDVLTLFDVQQKTFKLANITNEKEVLL